MTIAPMMILIKTIYVVCGVILFLYGLNSLTLSLIYLFNRKKIWKEKVLPPVQIWPVVSVQLPIYNEGELVSGLLESVTNLDYPRNKLQIQVLDDSFDSTTEKLKKLVTRYKQQGFWIEYQHRTNRIGYKAGNLASGLLSARGKYILILDADFEISREFLKKTIPLFSDPKIGFVQSRWTNRNYHENLITYLGGITYDAHLFVEQNARSQAGLFMGFSGSAGIWRKDCLLSIGGWKLDTLTEDIDISFKAQLNGWKGEYVFEALSSAELPNNMDAFKLQQFRWAKGSAQCFRRFFPQVVKASLPIKTKVMALLHLLSYVTIPSMPLLLLLVLPICLFGGGFITLFWWMALGGVGPAITFTIAQLEQKAHLMERLIHLPFVLLMAAGVSLDALCGVFSGLFTKGGEFIRTPRTTEGKKSLEKEKQSSFLFYLILLEILLGVYLLVSVIILWPTVGKYLAPWLLSSAGGFLFMAGTSIFQSYDHSNQGIVRKNNLHEEK